MRLAEVWRRPETVTMLRGLAIGRKVRSSAPIRESRFCSVNASISREASCAAVIAIAVLATFSRTGIAAVIGADCTVGGESLGAASNENVAPSASAGSDCSRQSRMTKTPTVMRSKTRHPWTTAERIHGINRRTRMT